MAKTAQDHNERREDATADQADSALKGSTTMSGPTEWPDPADKAHAIEQAKQLREQTAKGGLKFEAYLPPALALWLLDRIKQGKFLDPSEAVFVILGEHEELEPHVDLRNELLKRSLQAAIDDPLPGIPHEDVMAEMRERLQQPRPEPAKWEKRTRR